MFLDDEIVQFVLQNKPATENELQQTIRQVSMMCFDRIANNLKEAANDYYDLPIVKNVCNLYDSAAKRLEKENYPILQVGGFKKYLLSSELFKPLMAEIGLK